MRSIKPSRIQERDMKPSRKEQQGTEPSKMEEQGAQPHKREEQIEKRSKAAAKHKGRETGTKLTVTFRTASEMLANIASRHHQSNWCQSCSACSSSRAEQGGQYDPLRLPHCLAPHLPRASSRGVTI